MSKNKIFEERIVFVDNMPSQTKISIINKVTNYDNWKGYGKITYVSTKNGIAISKVEPIYGTPGEYFRKIEEEIGSSAVF